MIVITGAAGFIGSVLAKSIDKNRTGDLLLVDKFGSGNKWKNLLNVNCRGFADRDNFILDLENNKFSNKDISMIIHMGACTKTTEYDVDYLLRQNFDYSLRLCKWSLQNGVRFIYASSASVYGDGSLGFCDNNELTEKLRPLNPYGFSKWMFDQWLIKNKYTAQVVGLRFFNVFGPNEYHKGDMASVIYRYFPLVKKDKVIKLFKSYRKDIADGEQKRDFVYVKDLVNVIDFFIENKSLSGIYNLGSGKAKSFNDVAQAMFKALDYKTKIEYFEMPDVLRDKYQYFTEADLDKLKIAGYKKPFTELEDAIDDYIRNYLDTENRYF